MRLLCYISYNYSEIFTLEIIIMEHAPPPYSIAAPNYPATQIPDPPERQSFCSKCGSKLKEEVNNCTLCGQQIVISMQPVAMYGNYILPPPLQTYAHTPLQPTSTPGAQPATILQQPISGSSHDIPKSTLNMELYIIKDNRLIIDFEKVSCLPCQTVGVDPRVFNNAPSPLKLKGITDPQWRKWMEDLMEVQKKAPSIVGCMTIFCFPGLLIQTILCACFCPTSASHVLDCLPCFYGDWHSALKAWMESVNKELNPIDMHAKLLTYKPHNSAPRSILYGDRTAGKNGDYEMSFLVIGLEKQASEKLMIESWDHGVNDGCTSGIGRVL